MKQRLLGVSVCAVVFAGIAVAQNQAGYLDIFIAKVKPEKRAEFDAISKRIADANRRHKGDNWIAAETIYGDWNTVYFTSPRQGYAEAEKGFEAFFGALAKAAGGPMGGAKLFQDFSNCLVSSRAELRRRRLDLSTNFPTDPAALATLVGQSRWTRTVMVRLRPGRTADYETQLKAIKAARERAPGSGLPTSITESASGQPGGVFYITFLGKSLGDFDTTGPGFSTLLGEAGFQKYLKVVSETVMFSESYVTRFLPEISNPTEEIAAAAPDFWRPKPAAAPKAKPKAEAAKPTQ